MTNFGQETREYLQRIHKNISDIKYISCDDYEIPIDRFFLVADTTEYDEDYGHTEIPNITIHFDDIVMFRWEYDGKEWWTHLSTLRPLMIFPENLPLTLTDFKPREDAIYW